MSPKGFVSANAWKFQFRGFLLLSLMQTPHPSPENDSVLEDNTYIIIGDIQTESRFSVLSPANDSDSQHDSFSSEFSCSTQSTQSYSTAQSHLSVDRV